MGSWRCVLELNSRRETISGSAADLSDAIRNGADLRIGTEFLHNEHIDVASPSNERIREVAEFGVTYLMDDRWAAGIMSLRQPINLPTGFGPRPSMSFFLYNEDGTQAIARPHLDGTIPRNPPGISTPLPPENMPKYHIGEAWDDGTNAPSHSFVYDFDVFRYCVNDDWQEVLSHTADGTVCSGSLESLNAAFESGHEIKLGIEGLCNSLLDGHTAIRHEVFVQGGSAYYYTEQKLFMIGTHPVVRVRPAIPLNYASGNWDFGWLMVRTDGRTVYRRCDPYTLQFSDHETQNAVRWFATGQRHV
jgi:hypothetical protein